MASASRMPSRRRSHLHTGERVAEGVGFKLFLGAVVALVVGEGVGVGADDVAVDERRAVAGTAVGDGFRPWRRSWRWVGAVDFGEVEVGEVCDEAGDIAAGSVDLDGRRDGIPIIFNDI